MEESVTISTPDHVELKFEFAGLGSRFAAYLIDFLFLFLLMLLVGVVALLAGVVSSTSLKSIFAGESGWATSWGVAVLIVFVFLINWGYYVFFEGLRRGSTPGKRRLGIRVIRQDGLPVGFREAALRNLVRAADMLPPPCYLLGGLIIHLDPLGRRLGDMVAGTFVVVEKFEFASQGVAGAAWAARVQQGLSRQALTLPRGTLSVHQIELIEQFIARRHSLYQGRRELLLWQITEPLLPLLGEDRDALARDPRRAERCESILLEILAMTQTGEPKGNRTTRETTQPSLF
jgi:uncharacterized RDD family membrane protein YckC